MDTRIVWHPAGVTSLDPATGRIWWEHDFPIGLTAAPAPAVR